MTREIIRDSYRVWMPRDIRMANPIDNNDDVHVYLPDGRMLNAEIVKYGYGQIYTFPPNVKYVDLFLKLQREAREGNRGLWE